MLINGEGRNGMIKQGKFYKSTVMITAVWLIFAFVLRMIYEDLDNAMLQAVMSTMRNSIHISLLFIYVLAQERMVRRPPKLPLIFWIQWV